MGVVLGYAVVGTILYAFSPPWWVWAVAAGGSGALAFSRTNWGFFCVAVALAIALNWSVESGLAGWAEWLLVTLLAVAIARIVMLLVTEAKSQLQTAQENARFGAILLGLSGLGLVVGGLIGLALPS